MAEGKIFPCETKEATKIRRRRQYLKVKDTERYKYRKAAAQRRDREKNGDKRRAYNREYRQKNLEVVRAREREQQRKPKTAVRRKLAPTGDQIWAMVLQALAGKYDEPTRMDIAGETALAFLEGDATSIKDAVALGIQRHWKMFSKFATRSLDEEIADGLRLIDLISDDHERA